MQAKTVSIDYLEFDCPIVTPIECRESHNKKEHYIHWKICKFCGILKSVTWYKHQPEPIPKAKESTILLDFAIQTDLKIEQ